jgi:hypothetical protein
MPPSYNHSYLAYRLAKLMDDESRFNLHIEITIEMRRFPIMKEIYAVWVMRICGSFCRWLNSFDFQPK